MDFVSIVRGNDSVSDEQARQVFELLAPIVAAAPNDREAAEAAANTVSRMSRESILAAVLDWWLVVSAGVASPLGLAFHLPESLPWDLRDAMTGIAARSHEGLEAPPAQWVQAGRELDLLLGRLDSDLVLDSYGNSKLPGEREAWAFLQTQLEPTVNALRDGKRAVAHEADMRTYEKELKRCGIAENSRRWNEMVKRAVECTRRVNRVVHVQHVVQPWVHREVPPIIDPVPDDVAQVLGPLVGIFLAPLLSAESGGATPDLESLEYTARGIEAIAKELGDVDLSWLASVTDGWLETSEVEASTVRAAIGRRNAVVERIEGLRLAGIDTDEAELLLLEHDVAGADRVLDGLEERRRQDRRGEALTAAAARFRSAANDDRGVPAEWELRLDEAELLLSAADYVGAERLIQALDRDLQTTRRNDGVAALVEVRSRLEHFGASTSILNELDEHLRELGDHPDRNADVALMQRSRERLDSLTAQRAREVQSHVSAAHEMLETDRDLISAEARSEFELRLSAVETRVADDEVMAAIGLADALLADIDGQRAHRWVLAEGEGNLLNHVIDFCTQQLHFDSDDVRRLYVAAKTKPFVILAGLTGSGKSTIARLFAAALGANVRNGRFRRVAVRPDWIDQSEVLGAVNPLSNRFEPGWLAEVARQCEQNLDQLHVVLLDEMNLAPVEQYLAEYLSALEELRSGSESTRMPLYSAGAEPVNAKDWPSSLPFPPNLILIGTVNVDETTRVLSERVLDRANVLQLSVAISNAHHRSQQRAVQPWYVPFPEWDAVCVREPYDGHHAFLVDVGEILQTIGIGVGQRAHVELERFIANAVGILEPELSLDLGILQRFVPKVRGFKRDLVVGLGELHDALVSAGCGRSALVVARWLADEVSDDEFLDGTDARIGLLR